MKDRTRLFAVADWLCILLMLLPLAAAMALRAMFAPAAEGVVIGGAMVYLTIHMPVMDLPISEAQVNSWMVMLSILGLCLYLTHGITARGGLKRQIAAEWIVEKCERLIHGNMGDYFLSFAPFVAAVLALSAFSSLISLLGLYAPTSDLNVVAGWSLLVFFMITAAKMRCGPIVYLKSFGDPVPGIAPLNIISEFATPVSMAFRHYGNIMGGSVISVLIGAALGGLSRAVLGWLPGALGSFPLFRIGLPAILSIYFDVFSGVLQAYIFAMLTMLYVGGGYPLDELLRRRAKKALRTEM